MKITEAMRHPVDSFRTAPIPFNGAAVSAGMSMLMVETALQADGNAEAMAWGTAGATALLAVRGLQLAARSFRLRERLEDSLAEQGYNERIFATTIPDWCTRQTAIVACEQFDAVAAYTQLCEQSTEDAHFTWLPQI